jgi:hypothetical protein
MNRIYYNAREMIETLKHLLQNQIIQSPQKEKRKEKQKRNDVHIKRENKSYKRAKIRY